jgi:23S rRNA pseudouridine955/2504/2580 synthase
MQARLQITVSSEDDNSRLDRWFKRYYPHITNNALNKALRKNLVKYDNKKVISSQKVACGAVISIVQFFLDNNSEDHQIVQQTVKYDAKMVELLKNNILYRDDDIIAINKPYGLAVQGGSKIPISLDDLLDHLKFDSLIRPKLVHRLDKYTSGVLLLARNSATATILTQFFKEKKIQKTYWALVAGSFHKRSGSISTYLSKSENDGKEKIRRSTSGTKEMAVTHFKTIDQAKAISWIEFTPLTGQTHQLRVHSAELGAPIVGDYKYGGRDAKTTMICDKMHLHARKIIISNFHGKQIIITAPLSEHMNESYNILHFDQRE